MGTSMNGKIRFLNKYDFNLGISTVNMMVSNVDILICTAKSNKFLEIDWNYNNQKDFNSFQKYLLQKKNKQ